MNYTAKFPPLKGLIVEDTIPTADGLQLDLKITFGKTHPGTRIDIAHTVDQALKFLDQSIACGERYDFAIIDFKLPRRSLGDFPEPNFDVSRSFERESRDTILIHYTSYDDDPQIQRFMSHRDEATDVGRLCVVKKGIGWAKHLIDELARCVHSRRVRNRIEALFGRNEAYGRARFGERGRGDREQSLYIAELCADASQHWEQLTKPLQNQLINRLGYVSIERNGEIQHVLGVARPPLIVSSPVYDGEAK